MMSSLSAHFQKVRLRTEDLCAPLELADYIPQPVEFVSPAKWHLAHSTWFFEEFVLSKFLPEYKAFDPAFGYLFNSYYNSIGQRTNRNNRGFITRPGVEDVYTYRHHVTRHMIDLLDREISAGAEELILLGINHEQQHQELLITDLKYTLSLNPTFPVYDEKNTFLAGYNNDSGWLQVENGLYSVGFEGDDFSYDNERSRHQIYLQDFEISKALVTNQEYLEFIEDGAYNDFRHWLDEGWYWLKDNNIQHPLYWKKIEGKWYQYTLAGLKPLDANAILGHISHYEASAFAHWKGMRLPTEFEWEVAAPQFDWGQRWEHTASAYLAYPGFKVPDGAAGEYNGKFMINQMVLQRASVATAPGHSRITYRNFFHPHLQWQYSGIRLAR